MEKNLAHIKSLNALLRLRLESEFKGLLFNGHSTMSLPHILNVSFDPSVVPVDGDALIMGLDLRGVAVTSGSACTSGSLQPSHVLMAIGRNQQTARATIRFSLGIMTTVEELEFAVLALKEVVLKARRT
jgi:cysteine desulfurase